VLSRLRRRLERDGERKNMVLTVLMGFDVAFMHDLTSRQEFAPTKRVILIL
jgi:hypothetical protein